VSNINEKSGGDNMINIILASKSQYRKKMMEEANIPFKVIVSDADELGDLSQSFEEQLKQISKRKAAIVFVSTIAESERIIVAADQNIVFEDKMYGKPETIEEARELIKRMSGRDDIYAYTGNTLIHAKKGKILHTINECDISRMSMDNISDEDIKYGLMYGRSVIAEYLC
jgi:septum formation protein